jgi:hypothetical protein
MKRPRVCWLEKLQPKNVNILLSRRKKSKRAQQNEIAEI